MKQLEKYLLGKLIRELRTDKGWTQSQLCAATKRAMHSVSSRNTVTSAEQGNHSVKEDTYIALIKALGYRCRGSDGYLIVLQAAVAALYDGLMTHDFSGWDAICPQVIAMMRQYQNEPLVYYRMYHLYCVYAAVCLQRYTDRVTWNRMADWMRVLERNEQTLYLCCCFETSLYDRQSLRELKQLVYESKQSTDPLYATVRIRMTLLIGDLFSAKQQIETWQNRCMQSDNAYQMMCCRLYWLEWLFLMRAEEAGRQAERLLKRLFLEERGWSRIIVKQTLYMLHRYCMRKKQWETAYQLLLAIGFLDQSKSSLWHGLWCINRVLLEMPLFIHDRFSSYPDCLLFHIGQYIIAKQNGQLPVYLQRYICEMMMPLLADAVYPEWYEGFIQKEMKGLSSTQQAWKEYCYVLEQLL